MFQEDMRVLLAASRQCCPANLEQRHKAGEDRVGSKVFIFNNFLAMRGWSWLGDKLDPDQFAQTGTKPQAPQGLGRSAVAPNLRVG